MNSLSLLFSLFTALPPVTYLHVCMHVFLHTTLLSIELTLSQFMRLWGQLTHTTTYHSWLNLARLCVSFFFQSSKIKVFIVTILKWLDEKSKITMILVFRAIRNTVPSFIRTTFPYFSFCFPESTVVECQRSHDRPVVFRPSCCPTAELPRVTKTQKHHPLWPQHTWLHIQMYRHIHTEDRPSLTN